MKRLVSRLFSTKGPVIPSSVPNNKPLVVSENVNGRYSSVLFTEASKSSSLNIVHKDMTYISQLLKNSKKLSEFITNTSIKREEQKEIVNTIKANVGSLTNEFLSILNRPINRKKKTKRFAINY